MGEDSSSLVWSSGFFLQEVARRRAREAQAAWLPANQVRVRVAQRRRARVARRGLQVPARRQAGLHARADGDLALVSSSAALQHWL